MAPKRLNSEQIREVYGRRHRDSVPVRDLAQEFGVSVGTVRGIVNGKLHADVTGHSTPHAWSCTKCPAGGVREHNIDLARAAVVSILCSRCHTTIEAPVSRVLDRRGGVSCQNCDERLSR